MLTRQLPKPSIVNTSNRDTSELEKFSASAHQWWDPNGEFKTLHGINPIRLDWINSLAPLSGQRVADVGCGGGILSESMSRLGAQVTGIDLAEKLLLTARLHLLDSQLEVDYRLVSVEQLASESPESFHVVTCMEMLEHVPDPRSIVQACARLVKPGGHVFFSTLNRNPKAYAMAILGAEYLMRLLPRGTHDYERFIKPSDLARMARESGLDVTVFRGMGYSPLSKTYFLSDDTSVNYLMHCRKP